MSVKRPPQACVLDALSPAGGTILEDCEAVKKWSPAEVSGSLGASLGVL